jgi:phospholipid/cholesterol/gamma-HCH transport system substrate-binding protein
METRANYVLIGAFALAGFIGLLAFLLVFARIELDRQFDYYEVRFTSVGGLSRASEVRFAGLPVGQVVDVRLAPERDGSVLVRLEVSGNVPVREDSEATIEMMGVTGVSYVGISAGSPDAEVLDPRVGVPEIQAGRSVLQTLTEDAPEILGEALTLVRQVSELFDAANQQKVQNILDNLERSSEEMSQALIDFAGVTQMVGQAGADIAYFTTILEPVVEGAQGTMERIDTALETYTVLGARATEVLEDGDEILGAGQRALVAAETFLTGDLPVLMRELTETSATARSQFDRLTVQAETLVRTSRKPARWRMRACPRWPRRSRRPMPRWPIWARRSTRSNAPPAVSTRWCRARRRRRRWRGSTRRSTRSARWGCGR